MKSILLILSVLAFVSCQDDVFPPIASCKAFPIFGDTTILFEFNASKSVGSNGLKAGLTYRWDFDGDLIWDTEFRQDHSTSHYFINPGLYTIFCEVRDFDGLSDTVSTDLTVFGRNKGLGTLTDSRDGQVYRTVKIQDAWWMAENLRLGATIPQNTEQNDNGKVEMYRWSGTPEGDTIGGTYRWQEAMNYNLNSIQGICPDGWHIPTTQEWKDLLNGMPVWYAVSYYGPDGLSELNLHISNHIYRIKGEISSLYGTGGFWSSDFQVSGRLINPGLLSFSFQNPYMGVGFQPQSGPENSLDFVQYFSLRCKKD